MKNLTLLRRNLFRSIIVMGVIVATSALDARAGISLETMADCAVSVQSGGALPSKGDKTNKKNRPKQTVTPPNSFHVALLEADLFPKPHKQLDVSSLGAVINESKEGDKPELVKASGVIKAGVTFQIIRVQGEWLEIRLSDGKTGWVKSNAIIYDTFKMLVGVKLKLKNKINMYLVPKTASRKKKPLKAGENISVIAKNETWALVKSSAGRTGWATWEDIGQLQPSAPKIPPPKAKAEPEEEVVEEEVIEEEVVEEEVIE